MAEAQCAMALPVRRMLRRCTMGPKASTMAKAAGQAATKACSQRAIKSGVKPTLSQVTQAVINKDISKDINNEETRRTRKGGFMFICSENHKKIPRQPSKIQNRQI